MQPADKQRLAEAVIKVSDLRRGDPDIDLLVNRMVARHGSLAGFAAEHPDLFDAFYDSVVAMAGLDDNLARYRAGQT